MDADADCLCGNAGCVVAGISAANPTFVIRLAANSDWLAAGDCRFALPDVAAANGGL